ncbi:MAG: RIP metalloprotease RseP [Acidobacteria bacterium]|nr:MAG: RIP metalloprotease RseP [Acidobacteriota bacterium]
MSHFLISVLAMAVVLGFMILIHEFGHYAAAKFFNVRVEVFSIGFGKRLLGFRRGETDYRISAIPLGGYVKMAGENPMDELTGDPGEFLSHPRWQRFIIAVAGPAMNILLAIGLLAGVYMVRYEHSVYLDKAAVIGWVMPDTPAAKAGIEPGDRIVQIDGITDPTWDQVIPKVALSPNQPLSVTIERGNQQLSKTLMPEATGMEQYGIMGWVEESPPIVTELDPGMPAEKAGIKVGDLIESVNGRKVQHIAEMVTLLQEIKDKPIQVTVRRNGRPITVTLAAELTPSEGGRLPRYRVGIHSEPTTVSRLPFAAAVAKSIEVNKRSSFLILELIQKMVRRKISMRQVEGPIGIGGAVGRAASEKGWMPLLEITAAISLNLGIFNLLPIPILDGGVILLLLVESLIRRDISLRIKERIYQAAFVFLVLFAVMVIYNDLVKTLPGLAQRLP